MLQSDAYKFWITELLVLSDWSNKCPSYGENYLLFSIWDRILGSSINEFEWTDFFLLSWDVIGDGLFDIREACN